MINIPTIKKLIEDEGHVFVSSSQEQGSFGCVIFTHLKGHENYKYAIKVFDVDDGSKKNCSQEKIQECQKEARALKILSHKNVVAYHSEKQLGLFYFIIMEMCQSSLHVWSQSNQNIIQDSLFYSIARQILDGLDYIHNKDWILRDLKPQNILINQEVEKIKIKLCDFGAARYYPKQINPKSTNCFGTLNYMPPEVIKEIFLQNHKLKQTPQGDIWAYGICLLSIGKPILNFNDYIKKNWQAPYTPLLSEKAQKLIRFILIQDPKKRPTVQQIRKKMNDLFSEDYSYINLKKKQNLIFPGSELKDHPLNHVDIELQQSNQKQQENVSNGFFTTQISSPVKMLIIHIKENYDSYSEINNQNFPDKSEYIWLLFFANYLYHFILTLLYAAFTKAQNVLLVVLLSLSFVLLLFNAYFIKNKKVYFSLIFIQCLIITIFNLALNELDPVVFKVFFATYQIFILIMVLYFLNIPYKFEHPLLYSILVYPIFFQLQYSLIPMLFILILSFYLLLFSILLHLWALDKKIHLQGIFIAKSFFNFMTNVLLFGFYSQVLDRAENYCAAFLLNIFSIALCSFIQLKIQEKDQSQSIYGSVLARAIFFLNNMLFYVLQFCSLGIIFVCIIKITLSLSILTIHVFIFKIEEDRQRNKTRLYLESLFTFISVILDILGLAFSHLTQCDQGVAIFATLFSLDVLLLLKYLICIYHEDYPKDYDGDSYYIRE